MSLRIKEALHAKNLDEGGAKLGKLIGTIERSKQDMDRSKALAGLYLSIRKMAVILGYSNPIERKLCQFMPRMI